MSQWQSELNLKDVWDKCSDGDITIQELSKTVADRLSKLKPTTNQFIMEERDDLIENFSDLALHESATIEGFDDLMNDLYNWGDIRLDDKFAGKKVCWISTAF